MKNIILIVITGLLLFSCKKEEITPEPTPTPITTSHDYNIVFVAFDDPTFVSNYFSNIILTVDGDSIGKFVSTNKTGETMYNDYVADGSIIDGLLFEANAGVTYNFNINDGCNDTLIASLTTDVQLDPTDFGGTYPSIGYNSWNWTASYIDGRIGFGGYGVDYFLVENTVVAIMYLES